MSRLAVRGEVIKLAYELGCDRQRIGFLHDMPAEDLRRLRTALQERMFGQDLKLVMRLAAIARWLPSWVLVFVCRYWLGPILTGRVAGEIPAQRAVRVVARLPPSFVADTVVHLDPRRVRDVIQLMPLDGVVAIAKVVLERRDFITVGRIAEFLPDAAVRAIEPLLDPGDLLQIAFYIESKNRMDHLLHLVPREKIVAAIQFVQDPSRRALWPNILGLITHASYPLKRELGELAADQGETVLNAMICAIQEEDLWVDALPVAVCLAPDTQRRIVNLPILQDPAVLTRLLRDADDHGLWGAALSLIRLMDEDRREIGALVAARMPRTTMERAVYAALMHELWEPLLDGVARMPPAKQAEFAEVLRGYAEVDGELVERIARRAQSHGFGGAFETPIATIA